MYTLRYRRQARNYLARLPYRTKSEIVKKLHQLAENPNNPRLDVKALKSENAYLLRIGQFRVIYTLGHEELIIEIVRIRPRGDVYRG